MTVGLLARLETLLAKQARQPAGAPGSHGGEFASSTLGGAVVPGGGAKPAKAPPSTDKVLGAAGVGGAWSEAEKAALHDYQTSGYHSMNFMYRMGKGDIDKGARSTLLSRNIAPERKQDFVDKAKLLSSAMSRAEPIAHEAVVWRSVGGGHSLFKPLLGFSDLGMGYGEERGLYMRGLRAKAEDLGMKLYDMVGKTVTEHGFTSTTSSEGQAEKWTRRALGPGRGGKEQRVMFKITAPAGSKGLLVSKVNPDQKEFVVQKEWLLPPGTKFKITKVTRSWGDGQMKGHRSGAHLVEMEIVP